MQATPQRGGAGFPAGLARLVAGSGRRGWGGLSLATSSLAAVLVLTIAAVLSVLVLSGGSAQASFLERVDQLSAASAAALQDDEIDADEAAQLRARIDAVVAALEARPEELATIPLARAREALRTITAVRAALEGVGGSERADTAAVVSAALLQLDALAARLAAVLGETDAPRPAADRADAVDGADEPSDPSRPPAADGDPDRRDATGEDANRDDPADALRPDDSVPAERPPVADDPADTDADRESDAAADGGSDEMDPEVVPVRPSTDAAGDTRTPTEPTGPSPDGDDGDVVRPADGDTTDAGAAGTDHVRDDDGTSVDEDTTKDDTDLTTDQKTERPVRPPPTEPVPEEEPDRDADATTDTTGDDTGSLDSSSEETIRDDGSLSNSATGADARGSESPSTASAPR